MARVCICCKYRMSKLISDVSFFGFPKSDGLLKKWLLAIGTEKRVTRSSRICSRHFKEDNFRYGLVEGKRYLKPGAIPSLHLNGEIKNDPVSDNQDTIIKKNQPTNQVIEYIAETTKIDALDTAESCTKIGKDDELSERESIVSASSNEPGKKHKKYLYDVLWEEISTSPVQAKIYWEVAIKKIMRQKMIVRTLRQRIRRLEKQILLLQTRLKNEASADM